MDWTKDSSRFKAPPTGYTAEQISRKLGHELRSQLTGSGGLLDMLLDTELSDTQKIYAESIKCSTMTMMFMVNGMHDMIRMESGTFKPVTGVVKLCKIFNEFEFLFTPLAEERGMKIDFALDEGINSPFSGDSRRLGVILYHLISNAIQYSDQGSILVQASIMDSVSDDPDQVQVVFTVEDDGLGIPDELLNSFESKMSLSLSLNQDQGMGLLTCYQLISKLGGQFRINKKASRTGTQVQFWLPFNLSIEGQHPYKLTSELPGALSNNHNSGKSSEQISVLLADDDPVNRKFVTKLLEKNDITTYSVTNGVEAVDAFKAAQFDLVILDCRMPIKNGFEAVSEIRSIESELGIKTPVIIWSATTSDQERIKALDQGADEFILKPIDASFLIERVKTLTQNKH